MPATKAETSLARQERAIRYLLESPTIEIAAQAAGVGASTLHRWLTDAEFLRRYREARKAALEAAAGRLADGLSQAVDALRRNLTCGQPGVEVRAAVAICELARRDVERTALEDRLQALEDHLGGRWTSRSA